MWDHLLHILHPNQTNLRNDTVQDISEVEIVEESKMDQEAEGWLLDLQPQTFAGPWPAVAVVVVEAYQGQMEATQLPSWPWPG